MMTITLVAVVYYAGAVWLFWPALRGRRWP